MSKHWQSFGELNNTEAFQKSLKDEFKEELPFESDGGLMDTQAPRRDFLKYLGFTTAAAAIAASCEVPVKKSIPFANRPEDIVPGVSNYYATTYVNGGEAVSVLAKVRDGRPIKIEGNDLSPITGGGTSAKVQASVLDLYDGARLRFPLIGGKEATFEAVDKELATAIAGSVVILSSTINSPSSLEVIKQFLAKYPGSKHVQYDAVSYSGILAANKLCYGKQIIPTYKFDAAKAIVSIGADFLGTWISPVAFAKQYAKGKKLNAKNPEMSRHIAFETVASLTGSNADERFLHRPSETGAVVLGLLAAINGSSPNVADKKLAAGIEKAAKALKAANGDALVVCGSNDVNVQVVVNAINEALGANGKTIDLGTANNMSQAVDSDFAALLSEKVDTLIVVDANPVYSWFDAAKVAAWIKGIKTTISFNAKEDETSQLCKYQIPSNHYLESWGDAELATGHFSFLQPTINPLFKTRQWQDSLLKWSGSTIDYVGTLKTYWANKLGATNSWDKVLQDGIWSTVATTTLATPFTASVVDAAKSALSSVQVGKGVELQLYQKVAIGTGEGTSNPWLMEMPDPVTRATWDNYLIVSPAMAKELLKIDLTNNGQADSYEVQPKKKVVEVTVGGKKVSLPALIIPGTHPNTIGIALGYGRHSKVGRAGTDGDKAVGVNAFQFSSLNNGSVSLVANDVKLTLTADLYPVALTQTHNIYNTDQGNRTEVMKELTLAELRHNSNEVLEERIEELKAYTGLSEKEIEELKKSGKTEEFFDKFRQNGSIYKPYDKPGVKWGMSIDLNACNGCGACVVACTAENNVSVVGKAEVLRFHDMQWLRIDRYYSGNDLDNPSVVFQPLMCQHCDNAPCENVCPVAATNHSSEGLNQMTYNRCIGTRYCANNCPYKVRRFNWADYTGSDSFANNQDELNDAVHYMNDDLTRMVLNPDVTVRSRGVIEKCSFCVQRLQEGKLKAKKESRPLETGGTDKGWDLKVACQQSCPTEAIVFGNVNDKHSAITMHREDNANRLFYSLEQLHVMPNVSYMAKVRNIEVEKAEHKA
ncbi:MAG: TAT-variant-translocated molybdopterin oxidoreductase [Chitinophagaceae bacterium]